MKTFMEKCNTKRLLLRRGDSEQIFTYADLVEALHEGNLTGFKTAASQLEVLTRVAKMNKLEIVSRARRQGALK